MEGDYEVVEYRNLKMDIDLKWIKDLDQYCV